MDSGRSATKIRDLRTGTPVWTAYAMPPVATGLLTQSMKTDVVVIGAGITGALTAEALSALGLSVTIVDRRPPGHGSTAASTAILQFEIDTPLTKLIDAVGFERARRTWLRSYRAVADIVTLARRLAIRCDFRARRSLYLAGSKLDPAALAEEGSQRRAIGLPSIYLSEDELKTATGLDGRAALLSERAGDVNPLQLTCGLLNRAVARGVRIFCPAQIAEVVPSKRIVAMVTTDGIEIEARTAIFATGYELAKGVPAQGHGLDSTWAMATPPQSGYRGDLVIWEASDPYLYIRGTSDGRVLVGGEDEPVADAAIRDALIPRKIQTLQMKLKALMPWLDNSVDFAWAGTFGTSQCGLPSIGAVPGMPNCHAVLGYGGNGFTFGMIASDIIAASISGQTDPDADLFGFG